VLEENHPVQRRTMMKAKIDTIACAEMPVRDVASSVVAAPETSRKYKRIQAPWISVTLCTGLIALCAAGCASRKKRPAGQDVAVSKAAVGDATASGAGEYAPLEMASAQDKLTRANQAMAAKDYSVARELANQAQADAKLAQSKASSAKAQAAALALQDNIRVMREELERSSNGK
jgi:hypothetical protein